VHLGRAGRGRGRTNPDRGFTLVELLIVVVILGVLSTVTVFAVRGITNRSHTSVCQSDTASISLAVQAYKAGEGSYPTNLGALAVTTSNGYLYLKTIPSNYATRFDYAPSTGDVVPTAAC
jgi:prepilin-type N-terminal cleavage/methylation domain-containing protein